MVTGQAAAGEKNAHKRLVAQAAQQAGQNDTVGAHGCNLRSRPRSGLRLRLATPVEGPPAGRARAEPVDHPEAPRLVLIRHKSASDASSQGADHGYL